MSEKSKNHAAKNVNDAEIHCSVCKRRIANKETYVFGPRVKGRRARWCVSCAPKEEPQPQQEEDDEEEDE